MRRQSIIGGAPLAFSHEEIVHLTVGPVFVQLATALAGKTSSTVGIVGTTGAEGGGGSGAGNTTGLGGGCGSAAGSPGSAPQVLVFWFLVVMRL